MNLYIYNYNNYYNRIVKKAGDYIDDYADFLYYGPVVGVYGFTPGDGVDTTQILGSNLANYDGKGDYLIAHDPYTNTIDSRWFILDCTRTRDGQWSLTLHRDLMVDYYDAVVKSPCMIGKATLSLNDPLIFNKEGNRFNQIKSAEYLLKDKSECPWALIYYSLNPETQIKGEKLSTNQLENLPHIELPVDTLEEWEYYDYVIGLGNQSFYSEPTDGYYKFIARKDNLNGDEYTFNVSMFPPCDTTYASREIPSVVNVGYSFRSTPDEMAANLKQNMLPDIDYLNDLSRDYLSYATESQLNDFISYNGKLIKCGEKFYNVSIEEYIPNEKRVAKFDVESELQIRLATIASNSGFVEEFTGPRESLQLEITSTSYRMKLTEAFDAYLWYNITANANRLIPSDVPYGIAAIPLGDITIKGITDITELKPNVEWMLTLISKMWTTESSDIYDIQILPYCPCQELITDNGEITLTHANQYSLVKKHNELDGQPLDTLSATPVGVILNVPKARFTFDIPLTLEAGRTSIQRKVNNECDMWRLASPNYSNYFDFSVEQNDGVQYFNVDCEYKPYSPYIHLNPNFNNLYGKDFNDPRGLVLGGEFSITNIQSAWQQYQLQNKNYQNIFDRQISSMTTNLVLDSISGAASAVAGGFMGHAFAGPGGAIASGIAGAVDVGFGIAKGVENIDLQRDMFNYQLGNVQAMPHTIGKLTAFNNNNKLFPVLEYYTCTVKEKFVFANALAYNGMTVMATGFIKDYIDNKWTFTHIASNQVVESKNFIQGQLIRIEGVQDDYHVISSLSKELNKGVYFN
jgi:hypothetical protein